MDAQGPDKPRPYVDSAGAEFATAVDEENLLGRLYGFKAIPNGFLIDEKGIVRYKRLGGFDIRQAETVQAVDRWLAEPSAALPEAGDEALGSEHERANAHFVAGMTLYRGGKVEQAMAEWRKGVEIEPDNFIIRKQVWAVENPDKFYSGDVDYDWQKEQMDRGL